LQANLKWEPNLLDEQRLIPLTTDMNSSVILPKEIDNVSILIKQVDKMIIAGEGGAGKSRTLRYTAAKIAREMVHIAAYVSNTLKC
jgi:ABC-type dipeptide/oligopeptide/nickel transport system ATPase component